MDKTAALPTAKATVGHIAMRQAAEASGALAFFENITNSANGVDERALTFAIDFAT